MSIVFYTIGDWGKKSTNLLNVAKSMDTLSSTEEYKPNFIISLGDNFYPDGVESTDDEKWEKIYRSVFTGKNLYCPWYPILGNHDYGINPQVQIDYYKQKKDNRWIMPSRYYNVKHTYDNKKIEIICLDTNELDLITSKYFVSQEVFDLMGINTTTSREQLKWLEKTLSNSDADWLIVVGHYNLYTAGHHGSNNILIGMLKPLFIKYKVDMYISGHCHNLEHLVDNDIQYIVSGAGSKNGPMGKIFQSKFGYGDNGYTIHKIIDNNMEILFINEKSEVIYKFDISQKRKI
jgi:acid phosphatase